MRLTKTSYIFFCLKSEKNPNSFFQNFSYDSPDAESFGGHFYGKWIVRETKNFILKNFQKEISETSFQHDKKSR